MEDEDDELELDELVVLVEPEVPEEPDELDEDVLLEEEDDDDDELLLVDFLRVTAAEVEAFAAVLGAGADTLTVLYFFPASLPFSLSISRKAASIRIPRISPIISSFCS